VKGVSFIQKTLVCKNKAWHAGCQQIKEPPPFG
jgi:hypothetical protein